MAEAGRWRSLPEVAASEASVVATASCWWWCSWWCSWDSSALRFRGAGRRTSRKGQDGAGRRLAVGVPIRGRWGPSRGESAMVRPSGPDLRNGLVAAGRSGVLHDLHDHVPGEGELHGAIRTCSPEGHVVSKLLRAWPRGLWGRRRVRAWAALVRHQAACLEALRHASRSAGRRRPHMVVDEQPRTYARARPADVRNRSQRRAADSPRPRADAQHPSAPFTTNFGPETTKRSA